MKKPIGMPSSGSAIKTIRNLSKDTLGAFGDYQAAHGDMYWLNVGPESGVVITNPNLAKIVLQTEQRKFHKGRIYHNFLTLLTGNSIFSTEEEEWKRNRKVVQPAFHKTYLDTIFTTIFTEIEQHLNDLAQKSGKTVDWNKEMVNLTLSVVAQSIMGVEVKMDMNHLYRTMESILHHIILLWRNPFYRMTQGLTGAKAKVARDIKFMDDVIYGYIQKRQETGNEGKFDLLAMLLESHYEDTGEKLPLSQVRDEAISIFLAGHETSANAMVWALTILQDHPDVVEKVRQEYDLMIGSSQPTMEKIMRLRYTRQVVDECMRLKPSVWSISRNAQVPINLGGYDIAPGTDVSIDIYHIHRHPAFWENPEKFDPDRFGPQRSKELHRHAFLPFGGGPRMCVGNNFAYVEMMAILGMFLSRFDFQLVDSDHPAEPSVTLRPVGEVQVRITERNRKAQY
ncbi:MAG: cytochrome P450 [Bacteroidota bacterium]